MEIKNFILGVLSVFVLNTIKSQSISFDKIGFTQNGDRSENIEIISNKENFSPWWKIIVDNNKPLSTIDFEKERVIVVSRGTCATGSHGVSVDSVFQENDNLIVEITYTNPGDNCYTASVIIAPSVLIRINNKDLPLVFRKKTIIKDCEH
ncbi:MAG: protease complex subunit PrcB family protein [Bacteroidia bacterium]